MFGKRKKQRNEQDNTELIKDMQAVVPITLELADVSKGVYLSSKDLNECSKLLNEIGNGVEHNVQINKKMIEKVKNEVQSINIAAENIHTRAKHNEELSSENLKNVQYSMKDLNESIRNIEDIFAYVDEVGKTLEKLQRYSDSIGNITTYMDQIASKTSMVSMNASIEAARAGEAGRGFMVITDAIKGLADQSKEFSTNISGMLHDMTECIEGLNEISRTNREKITQTKSSITVLEENLNKIAQSTSELDKNIQGTLISSDEIKKSVELGEDTVVELVNSFDETIINTEKMVDAVKKQDEVVIQLRDINEKAKNISEEQINMVLNCQLEEKLMKMGEKVAQYQGARDVNSLQKLAQRLFLHSINYIDDKGCFEAAANPSAIGFNIFKVEPHYQQFKRSSDEIRVYPLSRNLFTGDVIRYVSTKHISTKQLISIGFNLKALKTINEMTMEQVEAL